MEERKERKERKEGKEGGRKKISEGEGFA